MKVNNKEVDVLRTVFCSLWSYSIIIIIFIGAMLYSTDFLDSTLGLKSVCFGGALMLVFLSELFKLLGKLTFFIYKKEETQNKKERKR